MILPALDLPRCPYPLPNHRLRPLEEKSLHFSERAQKLEEEREQFAQQAEEMSVKYVEAKRELEQTLKSLEDM